MKSQSFKGLFYEKVTNSGLLQHRGSFAQFFMEYLSTAVTSSQQCAAVVFATLCQSPFNVAFGFWWLLNPPADNAIDKSLPDKYFGSVPDQEKHTKSLEKFADFDLYHLLKENAAG
jgi:hypothetical protein